MLTLFFLMRRRPPKSTRTDTLLPYPTLFRSTMKSRAVVKDVGRVLGFTPAETDALAKLIPNQPNYSLTVADAVKQIPEIQKLYRADERYTQLQIGRAHV